MAVVIGRPKPVAQLYRLVGALIALTLLLAFGLGIARWRSAGERSGSPYGVLGALTPPAPAPDLGGSLQHKAALAPAQAAAPPPPAAAPAPAAAADAPAPADPAHPQPRVIALDKKEVGQIQHAPPQAVAAAAASPDGMNQPVPAPAAAQPAPAAPTSATNGSTATAMAVPAVPAPAPPVPAAAPAPQTAAPTPAPAPAGSFNINTASAEELNHIPGAGRIGRTIVRHRPYSSLQELVERRVLRASEFNRIKARLTTN